MFKQVDQPIYSLKSFLLIALILQITRLIVLSYNMETFGLYIDEVYYWGWAQNFDLGYFSKPPMIAWVIMLTTSIFGDGEVGVKIGSIFLYPLTASIIYLIAYNLFEDRKIAFFSAVSFITMPAISLSSIIISTDAVLLLFWSLSLLFFIKALREDKTSYWVYAGISAGFGLLSKYNMIFFLLSVALVLIVNKEYRKYFKSKNFYLSMLIAALIFIPNLYWQYTHDFISFAHTKEISQIEQKLFHFDKMFEFLGSQFLVFGPIFFAFFLYFLYKFKSIIKDKQLQMLYLFSLPYFLFITGLSFLSRAFANWSAPIYIAAIILVIAFLIKNNKLKLVKISIGIHLFLAFILYFYHPLASTLGIELTKKKDPYNRVYGYEQVAAQIESVKKDHNHRIIFEDRGTMAEMIYYMKPHPFDSLIYNSTTHVKNQYHMDNMLKDKTDETFLFVTKGKTKKSLEENFKEVELIKHIDIKLYKDFSRTYDLFLVKSFKGYR